MTIDEAIKHCEDVAEKYCEKVEDGLTADDFCDRCASEHRQIAEWLKELKAWREAEIVQTATDNTKTLIFNKEDIENG